MQLIILTSIVTLELHVVFTNYSKKMILWNQTFFKICKNYIEDLKCAYEWNYTFLTKILVLNQFTFQRCFFTLKWYEMKNSRKFSICLKAVLKRYWCLNPWQKDFMHQNEKLKMQGNLNFSLILNQYMILQKAMQLFWMTFFLSRINS